MELGPGTSYHSKSQPKRSHDDPKQAQFHVFQSYFWQRLAAFFPVSAPAQGSLLAGLPRGVRGDRRGAAEGVGGLPLGQEIFPDREQIFYNYFQKPDFGIPATGN